MKSKAKLSPSMTVKQFDNGYWYATELKAFAKSIGIPSTSTRRKDELEKAIIRYLETGKISKPTRRSPSAADIRDVECGLRLDLPVVVYTNDRETKDFLEREGRKLAPGMKRKSGARYRLNRWREDQRARGVKLTYAGLVEEYARLNQTEGRFAQAPTGRYINFISDYVAAEPGASRAEILRAWKKLKRLDAPKNYRAWVRVH